MNSFYVPALAGQIYAMPGMETKLHAVINHPGEYEGFSANYSGAGFSNMRFSFRGMEQGDFDAWVQTVKAGDENLSREAYLDLAKPSEREPARLYASADPELYNAILNMCADKSTMCMSDMAMIDAGLICRAPPGTLSPVAALAPRQMPAAARQSEPRAPGLSL